MIDTSINLICGTIIGVGISLALEKWTRSFFIQFTNKDFNKSNIILDINLNKFSYWILFFVLTVLISIIAVWRQLGPEFLNDIILVTALTGITQIDLKTMYIDGRIITLALLLRLLWLIFFDPFEMTNYFAGLFFGAGLLYLIGFFYQTFRNYQGLGGGDASVLGLIGFWIGWRGLGAVILIAALSGILISVSLLIIKKHKIQSIGTLLKTQIPFAPFLCFGGLIVYFFEEIGYFSTIKIF